MSRTLVVSFSSLTFAMLFAHGCGESSPPEEPVGEALQASSTLPIVLFCKDTNVSTDPGKCTASCGRGILTHMISDPTVSIGACTQSCDGGAYSIGTNPVKLTCQTDVGPRSCHERVIVKDLEPPVLTCTSTRVCSSATTLASLVQASDNCSSAPAVSCAGPDGQTIDLDTPLATRLGAGTSAVSCTATDSSGNTGTCTLDVTVGGGPPTIVPAGTVELWPPNHKYHPITLAQCIGSASDACGPIDVATAGQILYVTSNEVEDAPGNGQNGDGNTCDDININGTTVQVRAERDGTHDGRIYTIHFKLTTTGGEGDGTCQVVVPHDQGHPPVSSDDSCAYCVAVAPAQCPSECTAPSCE